MRILTPRSRPARGVTIAAGVAVTLALGCGDPLVGRHRLALTGTASARAPDGRHEPVALPPDVELEVGRSGDRYRIDLLGCSLLAEPAGATARLVAGQSCSLTVGRRTFEVVEIAGQVDARSDTGVGLTLTAAGPADAAGTPVHEFRLLAPGG